MVASPIIKILEIIALPELKKLCYNTMAFTQIGFREGGECQMHVVRILDEVWRIKSREGTSGKYFLAFIDFKSAFDSVDHEILFSLLEDSLLLTVLL